MHDSSQLSAFVAKIALLLSLACLAAIYLASGTLSPSIAQSREERVFEIAVPKHLPIKVKIKKEKEKSFKDMENDKWVRDFELEVTNTGDKPIYLLHMTLDLPEIIGSSGYPSALSLHYGRVQLGDLITKAEPDDIPIKPGETYVFKIAESLVLGWDSFRRRENMPQPKKVVLYCSMLSFGDGTGFHGRTGAKFPPARNERSGLNRCGPDKSDAKDLILHHRPRNTRSERLDKHVTGKNLAGNFFAAELLKLVFSTLNLQPQSCCSGNCVRSRPSSENSCYGCPPVDRLDSTLCSDPLGSCLLPTYGSISCTIPETGEKYLCLKVDSVPCGETTPSPTPSPTPTPTPTPSCDPNTKPNPYCSCALDTFGNSYWQCLSCPDGPYVNYPQYPANNGCPPNTYNDNNNCCVPVPTPTCSSWQVWNGSQCVCRPDGPN